VIHLHLALIYLIDSWQRSKYVFFHIIIIFFELSFFVKVRPKFLECLAVGCLYIAAKCKEEDDTIPITPEFVVDCNASCSANELLRMERLILEKLDWYADFVTSVDFLQYVRSNKVFLSILK
jgi:hypothetical protein